MYWYAEKNFTILNPPYISDKSEGNAVNYSDGMKWILVLFRRKLYPVLVVVVVFFPVLDFQDCIRTSAIFDKFLSIYNIR